MKSFLGRIARFVCSRSFLKFILIAVTLIVLFYVEEDWRGARAWAATKAKWEARGVSFDYHRLVPPPIPDTENLLALPLFKLAPDPEHENQIDLPSLKCQFDHNIDPNMLHGADWQRGELVDMARLRASVSAQFAVVFPSRPAPARTEDQFAALYPFVGELREASTLRSGCRFPIVYPLDFSNFDTQLSLVTAQVEISKFLSLDAYLALDAGDPDRALADVRVNNKITLGLMDQPTIVTNLVAVADTAIILGPVYDGIARHLWTDAQLAEIDGALVRLDFLSSFQRAVRGEAIAATLPMFDQMKIRRKVEMVRKAGEQEIQVVPFYWPNGWIDLQKTEDAEAVLTVAEWVAPHRHRANPRGLDEDRERGERGIEKWTIYLPWVWLFRASPSLPAAKALETSCRMQVWVDQTRIACALERYRLAHGAYPSSLGELVTAFITEMPPDIFNGEPYRYQHRAEGRFALYSVGWNQIDDGGTTVFQKGRHVEDRHAGDWVWPTSP